MKLTTSKTRNMKFIVTALMKLTLFSASYNLFVDENVYISANVNSMVNGLLGNKKTNLTEFIYTLSTPSGLVDSDDAESRSNQVDCFGLGKTFATTLEWFFMSKPNGSDALNVQFLLSSRNQPQRVQVIIGEQFGLEWTDFRIERRTVIIVHGFLSHGQESWITDMEKSFLEWVRKSIIITDYFKCIQNKIYFSERCERCSCRLEQRR